MQLCVNDGSTTTVAFQKSWTLGVYWLMAQGSSDTWPPTDTERHYAMPPSLLGCQLEPLDASQDRARWGRKISHAAGLTQQMQCQLAYEGVQHPIMFQVECI
jgi:hypothetical protein